MSFNAAHTPFDDPPFDPDLEVPTCTGSSPQCHRDMIRYMDLEIARLLTAVDLATTTVIFVGDNGSDIDTIDLPNDDPYEPDQAKETLYERFSGDGLEVLGFPCNQFGKQEPGDAGEIRSFCDTRFGVTFPLFAKVDVNGAKAHPLYRLLKDAAPGVLGTKNIKWNFTKFLVGRDGRVLGRYGSTTKPEALEKDIRSALDAR